MAFVAPIRYTSRYLLVSPQSPLLEDACVVVEGRSISYAGPRAGSDGCGPFEETVDLGRSIVIPGFVNTHAHSAMSLLRGVGNGLSLDSWLKEKVWPLEARLSEKDMVQGNLLSLAEYLRTGITTFIDFYNVRPMLSALERLPLRATLSLAFLDLVPGMEEESWRRLKEVKDYRRLVEDGSGLRHLALAVHSAYACSEEMIRGVARAAEEWRLLITSHVQESRAEMRSMKKKHGSSTTEYFRRMGLLKRGILAAHGVHLSDDDISVLARCRSTVAHCPRSNSRLGVGIAPIPSMLQAGLNVSIGTDGAGSCDSVDFFEEMRVAAYLQRARTEDAAALDGRTLLRMAMTNGSSALGLPTSMGLKKGSPADFTAVSLKGPHVNPSYDLLSNVVFAARPDDVRLTAVDGKVLYDDGEVVGLDLASLTDEVNEIAGSLGRLFSPAL